MREPGYYWVRSGDDWEIAEYYGEDLWMIMGCDMSAKDSEWSEIGERLIHG